ncbi:MAG: universal stress protein UspA [Hyphomicrobiales bacterium]|jgi:nucleotide-binding universal stress UspA family protein|nr:universal stress protein UspA [Hyphomicrobiales bacterium]
MFKTILVAVDLAEMNIAKPAIEQAAALAEQSGGALRLVNVQALLPATFMDYVPADFDEQMRENAETALKHVAEKVPLPHGRVSWTVRVGGVYPEILAEADACGADLVVIGSHRPDMSTYLLGSNAKTVARHAKCSVLIVRE